MGRKHNEEERVRASLFWLGRSRAIMQVWLQDCGLGGSNHHSGAIGLLVEPIGHLPLGRIAAAAAQTRPTQAQRVCQTAQSPESDSG
jgi:hypothetical protein